MTACKELQAWGHYIISVVCLSIYTDYSGFQQNLPYGSYPPASQQATLATSYSVPSSVSSTAAYANPSQVSAPSATYNYATGQTATPYAAPPPVQPYTAYQVPAAPAPAAAAAPPPPIDPSQYGRPPPPPPPNQQNVSFRATAMEYKQIRLGRLFLVVSNSRIVLLLKLGYHVIGSGIQQGLWYVGFGTIQNWATLLLCVDVLTLYSVHVGYWDLPLQ